jgi:hypothetical protein
VKPDVMVSTISKILSPTSILTSWLARTVTSSKDRQIGAYSIGLTIEDTQLSKVEAEEERLRGLHSFTVASSVNG